jgi:hypothetical protein
MSVFSVIVTQGMKNKGILSSESFLGLLILGIILWYGRQLRSLLPGVLYLIAASYLCLFYTLLAARRQKASQGKVKLQIPMWSLHRKASVLLLFAWELAIIGLLNIRALDSIVSQASYIRGYLSIGVCLFLSYKMVGLADASDQYGGSKPLNYFGRPRSRRIFVVGFIFFPVIQIVILSLIWAGHQPSPQLFRPPEVFLLLLTLLSAITAGLVFHRYRGEPPNKTLIKWILIPTASGMACTMFVDVIAGFSTFIYVMSSITTICAAGTAYWLLLGREEPFQLVPDDAATSKSVR